jgi:hypothetical protein
MLLLLPITENKRGHRPIVILEENLTSFFNCIIESWMAKPSVSIPT